MAAASSWTAAGFDWAASGKFPDFTEPDESYHGVVYTREFGSMAYIIKARMQLMRDFGCYPAAHSAFLLNLGSETLPVRMKRYCENALTVAEYLQASDRIASVRYPALPWQRTLRTRAEVSPPLGTSGVMSVDMRGGRDAAMQFMDSLQLACNEVHVADIRTPRAASGQRNPPPAHGRAARCRRYRAGPLCGFRSARKMWRTLSRTLTVSLSSAEAAVWKQRHAKHRFCQTGGFPMHIRSIEPRDRDFSSAATRRSTALPPATMQSCRRTPSVRPNCH